MDEPAPDPQGDDEGPIDPRTGGTRAVGLQPALVAVVWLGGAAGTCARFLLSRVVPHVARVPVATLLINVVGAFALGVLLEALVRRGSDVGRRRILRLLLGTGFLGGFTTYSALAVDTVTLARDGLPGHAVSYATASVLVGGLASVAGVAVGARTGRRTT
jgi:CrcB protein